MTSTDVFFDSGADEEAVRRAQAAFEAASVPVTVHRGPYAIVASAGPSLGDPFMIVMTAATTSFLSAFAAKAGADAYQRLVGLIGRLRDARASDNGRTRVIVRHEGPGPDIRIDADTPDGALAELLTGEIPDVSSGEIHYDRESSSWVESRPS